MKTKHLPVLLVSLLFMAGCITEAAAASLIDAAGTTAIVAGYTDLLDTIKAILSTSWQYILGGAALLASPKIVKGLFHVASSK